MKVRSRHHSGRDWSSSRSSAAADKEAEDGGEEEEREEARERRELEEEDQDEGPPQTSRASDAMVLTVRSGGSVAIKSDVVSEEVGGKKGARRS